MNTFTDKPEQSEQAAPDAGDSAVAKFTRLSLDERHRTNAETHFWCAQYREIAKEQAATIDALRREVEELKADRDDFHMKYRVKCDEETKALVIRAEAAERELAACREDAENYRFLRNNPCLPFGVVRYNSHPMEYYGGTHLDAAIKAERGEG